MANEEETTDLEILYRERYRHFVRVAQLITHNEESAHEAVQEAFAKALRDRQSYRGEGSLEAWVWRSVVNTAKKQQRRRQSVPWRPEHHREAEQNGHRSEAPVIRAWVAALPERQRMVVFLRYYADLDYRTIAAALGVEVGTVAATLSAARRTLGKALEEVSK